MKIVNINTLRPSCGHLVAEPPKCLKSAFWKLPGTIWWPRHETLKINVLRPPGPFGGRGTTMLKIKILRASWGYLVAAARKCQKSKFWDPPGQFGGLCMEIFQTSILGASWSRLVAMAQKMLKLAFWELLGQFGGRGLTIYIHIYIYIYTYIYIYIHVDEILYETNRM